MNSFWEVVKNFLNGKAVVAIVTALTLAVIFAAGGARSEWQKSDTSLSVSGGITFNRHTESQRQEGKIAQKNHKESSAIKEEEEKGTSQVEDERAKEPGGNWVSANSTMRYQISGRQAKIEMHGYDVMRGRDVFVGTGQMIGRELIIPRFYSFLDDTYGTLQLALTEDGKTLEGNFQGLNPTHRHQVILLRVP